MGYSARRGPHGQDPHFLNPLSPGPWGINDAGSFDLMGDLLGDTPGPMGFNDHAAPDTPRLLDSHLHVTISLDKDLGFWDYDPNGLLQDDNLNPDFVETAYLALERAVLAGLRPRVHQAFRTPQDSAAKNKAWTKGKGGRAAGAWRSAHNYGLAMDVYLYDRRGVIIDNHYAGATKGWWYKQFKLLAEMAEDLEWGAAFDDSDHFEYHPDWIGGAKGDFLQKTKAWAQKAALADAAADKSISKASKISTPAEPPYDDWIDYFWWAAGAGGESPASDFLSKNPAPSP